MGGSTEQQKLAWEWVEGMQQTSTMEHVTSLMYYLPTKPAVTDQVLKGGPEYTVFAKETQTARSRTTEYGANYPKVSQAIWTAIQGRDHRHLVGELGAADGAGHSFRSAAG